MIYKYSDISLTEIPNEISLVLYSPSCNMTCPWCFNKELRVGQPLSFKQMKDAIDEHADFVGGVVFSGGEPLLNPYLTKTINYAKSKGFKVKLNTNGIITNEKYLNAIIPYIDYMNISLKGTFDMYNRILMNCPVTYFIPYAKTIEYSLVYIPQKQSKQQLLQFSYWLKERLVEKGGSIHNGEWTQPDIFTISQFQPKECLSPLYCKMKKPSERECIEVAKMFKDIPRKKIMVETIEFGRKTI